MYDKEVITDLFDNILWALEKIDGRFKPINTADDFLNSDDGLEKLDSICMQLINIGEAVKRIDKITNKNLLRRYPNIKWKEIMGMRDIITHHYFDIDAETVFTVCEKHAPDLYTTITKIRKDTEK
ncbi:MAG: DUF86 domain-containing protein [Balneolaceae bacterium]